MASIANIGLKYSELKPNEKGYVNVTVTLNDETNQFGQNVTVTKQQTKEQREQKIAKEYVGNGKVVWTDGKSTKAVLQNPNNQGANESSSNDLPF